MGKILLLLYVILNLNIIFIITSNPPGSSNVYDNTENIGNTDTTTNFQTDDLTENSIDHSGDYTKFIYNNDNRKSQTEKQPSKSVSTKNPTRFTCSSYGNNGTCPSNVIDPCTGERCQKTCESNDYWRDIFKYPKTVCGDKTIVRGPVKNCLGGRPAICGLLGLILDTSESTSIDYKYPTIYEFNNSWISVANSPGLIRSICSCCNRKFENDSRCIGTYTPNYYVRKGPESNIIASYSTCENDATICKVPTCENGVLKLLTFDDISLEPYNTKTINTYQDFKFISGISGTSVTAISGSKVCTSTNYGYAQGVVSQPILIYGTASIELKRIILDSTFDVISGFFSYGYYNPNRGHGHCEDVTLYFEGDAGSQTKRLYCYGPTFVQFSNTFKNIKRFKYKSQNFLCPNYYYPTIDSLLVCVHNTN